MTAAGISGSSSAGTLAHQNLDDRAGTDDNPRAAWAFAELLQAANPHQLQTQADPFLACGMLRSQAAEPGAHPLVAGEPGGAPTTETLTSQVLQHNAATPSDGALASESNTGAPSPTMSSPADEPALTFVASFLATPGGMAQQGSLGTHSIPEAAPRIVRYGLQSAPAQLTPTDAAIAVAAGPTSDTEAEFDVQASRSSSSAARAPLSELGFGTNATAVSVAVHALERGVQVIAHIGVMTPDDRARLKDKISALLGEYGVHNAALVLLERAGRPGEKHGR